MTPTNLDRIRILAKLMRASRPTSFARISVFLGAGAPRGAGLPLADELKDRVAQTVFPEEVPPEIRKGRLEDALELFQRIGGRDGYELVAAEIRAYSVQPEAYPLLADIIAAGLVETVFTTNFDLLLDRLPAVRPVRLSVFTKDEDFEHGEVETGHTLVAKLHGCASDPPTMRGSWTDTRVLPAVRAELLSHHLANFPTIFVGWAALDPDILPVFQSVAEQGGTPKIFWVNPDPNPPAAIAEALAFFDSSDNYISLPADQFFKMLHRELFPEASVDASELDVARAVLERLGRSTVRADLETKQTIREARESFRHRLDDVVNQFVKELKAQLAPATDLVITAGRRLEVRTGGPAVRLDHEIEYTEDGDDLTVHAVVDRFTTSKPGSGAPLPPAIRVGAASFVVEWGSEAGLNGLRAWLRKDVASVLYRGLSEIDESNSAEAS